MFECCFGGHGPNVYWKEFFKTYMQLKHWYQFLCNIHICARSMLIELPIRFGWLTLKFLSKQCYRYAYYHRSPQRFFFKTRATWTTSLTWKKQFLVTFRFVAYAISFLNFESIFGEPALVHCLWMALTV